VGTAAALAGGAGLGAATLGYEGLKEAGFLLKDHVSAGAGDAFLKGLVQLTAGEEDTLPSRPTYDSVSAGILGAEVGALDSIYSMWTD
jgi:hypothetical protein